MIRSTRISIRPKQSLGQNFLIDNNIARNIVRDLRLEQEDIIVEIGPGEGALTQHIAGRVKRLIAVEVDGRAIDDLRNKFQLASVEIIHQNFLDVSLLDWKKKYKSKLKIVGNIPYHLTSPILFKVFEERDAVQSITFMIQREVAVRISAKPNTREYGILAVLSQFYGVPQILFNVSPNCFYPKPKVTSTVVQIKMKTAGESNFDYGLFHTVVRTAFGKRRKTLRNCLKYLPLEKDTVQRIIEEVDFPMENRPEQLSGDEFIQLTRKIKQIISIQ